MDDHTLLVLEFPKVLARLADFAASAPGREALLAVRPLRDAEEIRRRQRLTADFRRLQDERVVVPLDGIHDLKAVFQLARMEDSAVEPAGLLQVADELQAARLVRQAVLGTQHPVPDLKGVARSITPLPRLEERLREAIADDGTVTDRASADLRAIRRDARSAEEQIRTRVEAILRSREAQGFLQDAYVTQRDGRTVLPVKAAERHRLRGIVHDRSDSGNTVFIEPEEIVEPGNRLRDLRSQERTEVQRILRQLTREVGAELRTIELNHWLLVDLDFFSALARFAAQFAMTTPALSDRPEVVLLAARHPLLVFAGHPTVPIDVRVGETYRTLVITGPNTGGKTVTLKTVGLLALLAQAGLPVPVDAGSRLGVFEKIYCDIGDEQSIEQSLSTFSAHLTRIIAILAEADGRTLALLDELGAGTDPAEGGPLGEAILEALLERGAVSIATTHLSDLKLLAHLREGMSNASVAFDPESLRPTYRLIEGLPGNSNALIIARRLGMPEDLVARARAAIGEKRLDLERIIRDLHEQRRALEQERDAAQRARSEVAALEERLREQVAGWKAEKANLRRSTQEEAERFLEEARREIDALLEELKRKERGEAPAKVREEARRRLNQVSGDLEKRTPGDPESAPETAPTSIRPGLRVRLAKFHATGTVTHVNERKRRARVDTGDMTIEVSFEDLAEETSVPAPSRAPAVFDAQVVRAKNAAPTGRRLHLLGRRVDEAKAELRRFLDSAFLVRHPSVEIVHGYGTGALQDAVREILRAHPLVGAFRAGRPEEGGQGVTVVEWKRER